jgi:hypothetical protein
VAADKAPVVDTQADQTTVTADATVAPTVKHDQGTTVVEEDVAPTVEHETVTKEHEEKEKTVVDKERHQDHYHTTVVPAQTSEVLPEEHRYEDTATEVKEFEHDDGAAKTKNEARKAGFQDITEEGNTVEKKTEEATEVGSEQVHHHLHETIQPVIEKGSTAPSYNQELLRHCANLPMQRRSSLSLHTRSSTSKRCTMMLRRTRAPQRRRQCQLKSCRRRSRG